MADEPTTAEKPLAPLVEAEKKIDPPAPAPIEPPSEPAPAHEEPMDGAERLRAFEDEHFGADAIRLDGKIERGIGSKYSLTDEITKAEHAALERLVEAEQKLLRATAALDEAKAEFTAALEATDNHAAQ